MIEPLAKELGVGGNRDPRIIASWYDIPLPQSHTILARLPLKAVVTTNYDLSERKVTKNWAGADHLSTI
ncbi:MAG: hypothetical protein AYK18_06115 [Theionarchaea archaeon DG-70]|nr:MAG: hypothetical protein AYK18_06115 [Theionarchaea archaeon DG-70]